MLRLYCRQGNSNYMLRASRFGTLSRNGSRRFAVQLNRMANACVSFRGVVPPPAPSQVLELFGVDGEESVSLLSASGGPNINTGAAGEGASGEEVIEAGPSRVFYCVVMACASAFAAMAMTSWARTDG